MSRRSRREFLKSSGLVALGAPIAAEGAEQERPRPSGEAVPDFREPLAPALETVRLAFVGVGGQGGSHVRNFLRIDGVEIVAICDVDEPRAAEVAGWVESDGRSRPELYTRSDTDWRRLCERDDVDLVFNSTPWRWHVPVCVEAMESGKHTAVEVPAAITLDGCWRLVETAAQTGRHCVMMENCCYGRREMMILNMVRGGLLGELLHAEAAYIHDLRTVKFSDRNEGLWRLAHSIHKNANLYPTHGLGPVAQCLDIDRGDRFEYLVSMSSPARGLDLWAERTLEEGHPRRRSYALGDMNTSLIKTARGRTIMLQHDTASPRPYSRINLVQGTKGTVTGYSDRAYVEGRSEHDRWQELEEYRAEWDHPLWRRLEEESKGAGHGGMDYLEDRRLIECLRRGEPMDMDVYDAASWSCVVELTEKSVAAGSQPVEFPDFTRGAWRHREPLGIVG